MPGRSRPAPLAREKDRAARRYFMHQHRVHWGAVLLVFKFRLVRLVVLLGVGVSRRRGVVGRVPLVAVGDDGVVGGLVVFPRLCCFN